MVTQRVRPTPKRVRELIEVAAALLGNIKVTGSPVTSDAVYDAFAPVRQMIDEAAMEEPSSKPTLAILVNWQRRYAASDDVHGTMVEDISKFVQDAASIVISLDDDKTQTAMSVAKFFALRILLFVRTIQGIWPNEPENVTRLKELSRIESDLLAIVEKG